MSKSREPSAHGVFLTKETRSSRLASLFIAAIARFGKIMLPLPNVPNNLPTQLLAEQAGCIVVNEQLEATKHQNFHSFLEIVQLDFSIVQPDRYVIAPTFSSRVWPAAIFSSLSGRKFETTDDVNTRLYELANHGAASITVFAHPRNISPETLREIAENQRDVSIGLIPTLSKTATWAWLARWALGMNIYNSATQSLEWIDASGRDQGAILEYSEGNSATLPILRSIVMEYHSKESCGLIGRDSVLCGRPFAMPSDFDPKTPSCIQGDCIWSPDHRVPASLIRAENILMLTCNSLRFANATLDHRLNLGLAAFEGFASSLIAPFKVVFVSSMLRIHIARLLTAGLTLGGVVTSINKSMLNSKTQAPGFALLGDPDDVPDVFDHRSSSIAERVSDVGTVSTNQASGICPPFATTSLLSPTNIFSVAASESVALKVLLDLDCEKSLWLPNMYPPEMAFSHKYSSSNPCIVCGRQAEQFVRVAADKSWTRKLEICLYCSITADMPEFVEYASLDSLERMRPGDDLPVRIRMQFDKQRYSYVGIAINHARRFGWSDLPIVLQGRRLTKSIDISVTVPTSVRVTALGYSLHVWSLIDKHLCFLARPLVVELHENQAD